MWFNMINYLVNCRLMVLVALCVTKCTLSPCFVGQGMAVGSCLCPVSIDKCCVIHILAQFSVKVSPMPLVSSWVSLS